MLTTTDPRTGAVRSTGIEPTSEEEVAQVAAGAEAAYPELIRLGRTWRADLLGRLADALEGRSEELVATAVSETGLGAARLGGELTRSAFQLRLFGDVVREGSYLEATIDHEADTPMGPGPDLRRMLLPIGPIAVFGSSNFPFAFSVPGGDTASGLAAGCPVVLKAHGSHLETSRLAFTVMRKAAEEAGAPEGTLGIVYGTEAGAALIRQPAIQAVGFTGSLSTGKILLKIIENRPQPIPFYGELSSVNPLIVTERAAAARAAAIAEGLFASFTGSAGQLCTKPGIALVPRGAAGDKIVGGLVERAVAAVGHPLLNERIFTSYGEIRQRLIEDGRAELLVTGSTSDEGFAVAPTVLQIDAANVTEDVTEEAFGPLIVVARYDTRSDLLHALDKIPRSLTATIHVEADEPETAAELVDYVRERAGRIVFNGYPTGVRVAWAQHHGGPWPATNTFHTSVGPTAIRRFLRPFAWQDAPEVVLPPELREGDPTVPRRVDGVLTLPIASPTVGLA
jgi:NADP-dependent aldehyde dehydrogenase